MVGPKAPLVTQQSSAQVRTALETFQAALALVFFLVVALVQVGIEGDRKEAFLSQRHPQKVERALPYQVQLLWCLHEPPLKRSSLE